MVVFALLLLLLLLLFLFLLLLMLLLLLLFVDSAYKSARCLQGCCGRLSFRSSLACVPMEHAAKAR